MTLSLHDSKKLINKLNENLNKPISELKDIEYKKENLAKYRLVLKNDNIYNHTKINL